jgi:acyl-coenzyme A synthetase/AMP-(fatty) acid ligase
VARGPRADLHAAVRACLPLANEALIVDARQLEQLEPHLGGVRRLEHVIAYGGEDSQTPSRYEQLLGDASSTDPGVELNPDDVHVIRFSAGTTGRPKGIYHTPQGEIGEIAVATPGAMSGLWNDPDGTAARLLADGSVLTRDMGGSTRRDSFTWPIARRT